MSTPQPAKGWADIDRFLADYLAEIEQATAARRARYEVTVCTRRPTGSVADRIETAARVLHGLRHRAGTAHTCDRCREDAAAVAAVLTAPTKET